MQPLKAFAILLSASLLTPAAVLLPAAPAAAANKAAKPGNVQARAKPSVNKPQARPASAQARPAGNYGGAKSNSATRNTGTRNTASRDGNRTGNVNRGGNNNVVTGNTVVVNKGNPGNGYYNNGRYYGPGYYEDDDNDFLEFVGKTAAVTAGVAVVSAVIGSVVKDKPSGSGCTETISNGVPYVNCNGTWYQAVSQGYQVVPPPTGS